MWLGIATILLCGCVAPRDEWNLWPLFQYSKDPVNGSTETRLAGPLVRVRRAGEASSVAVHPLFASDQTSPTDRDVVAVWPFVRYQSNELRSRFRLLPFVLRRTERQPEGVRKSLWIFPFLYLGSAPGTPNSFALLPFFGRVHDILGRDEISFFLFPLWLRSRLETRESWNVLWPFFGGASDSEKDAGAFRAFPFYAHRWEQGVHDRYSILWPFFHRHENRLDTRRPTTMSLFFPFYGVEKGPDFRQDTLLWPFFGFGADRKTGSTFTAAPWPIYVHRKDERVERERIWPFWGKYESPELRSRYWLWPFIWHRVDETPGYRTETRSVLPVYRHRARTDKKTEETRHERHVWPLLSVEPKPDGSREIAVPSLNPFQDIDPIDRLYDPLWTVYRRTTSADRGEVDVFFGAVRHRWSGETEQFSIPWLYSSERDREGLRRSFLLGLVGWSSDRGARRISLFGLPILRFGSSTPADAALLEDGP